MEVWHYFDFQIGNSNRKNNRRFSAADTEAIKRVAAIDSLLEAVSSDQQLSKIESLIDELSQKLRDIENQNHLDESVFVQNGDDLENMKDVSTCRCSNHHFDVHKNNSHFNI